MPIVDKYAPGSFCWSELVTTDADAAKKFYGSLFGWTCNEFPMGEMGTYHMMQIDGRDVCAMYTMGPQMQGVPPHWNTYVSVDNVDEAVARAERLGAKAMMPPMDVFEHGRMAMLTDPSGAAFALWQPKQHIGAGLRGGHGATCWNELITTDANAVKAFYTELFGWKLKESPEYNEITNADATYPQGGIMPKRPDMGPMPSTWMVYFQTDALDGSIEKARTLGATLLMGPMDVPSMGRFAVLKDPQGAVFQLYEGKH